MKVNVLIIIFFLTFSISAFAIKGTSTISITETVNSLPREPADEDFYIDPEEINLNDSIAVENEKNRIRENLKIKRQQDWEWRKNRGAR
jgi:hypothetical protein